MTEATGTARDVVPCNAPRRMSIRCLSRYAETLMHRFFWMLVLSAAACGHIGDTSEPPGHKHASPVSPQSGKAPFVGHWSHDLTNGESYLIHFFPSGIVGFQHVGPELPISRSYGRWSVSNGALVLAMHDDLPDRPFPLPTQLVASIDPQAQTLTLATGTGHTMWKAYDTYGASRAGWEDRAAKSERDWAYLVERSERANGRP